MRARSQHVKAHLRRKKGGRRKCVHVSEYNRSPKVGRTPPKILYPKVSSKKYKFIMADATHLTEYRPESQRLVWMSPKQFLKLASGGKGRSAWESRMYADQTSVNRIKKMIKEGKPVEPLFFDVDINTKYVLNHEGRHRAVASYELGVEKVPVIVYYKRESGFINIEGKKLPELSSLKTQVGYG